MGRRQQQHGGRSAEDRSLPPEGDLPTFETPEQAAEDAREVGRLLDRAEGYDAGTLREDRDGPRPPRKTKGNQGQG